MTANVNIRFNEAAIMAEIDGQRQKANFAMGVQVLEDSNIYCKRDTKALILSSMISSSDDLTTIQWVTPYANRQYYLPAARKDINPNATWKWFETAKSMYLSDWIGIYNNVLKGGAV